MFVFLLSLAIGAVAGLRAMTAPAAISWAVHLGWIDPKGTWLAFLGQAWAPWVFTLLAIAELISDQLPSTPSRTVPVQFGTRIVMGFVCGTAIALPSGAAVGGIAGAIGAVIGTLGGRALRGRLAKQFGSDRPAALIEDAIALGGGFLVVFLGR